MRNSKVGIIAFATLALSGIAILIVGTLNSLDVRFYYTAQQADDFLRSLSPLESQRYLRTELLDLIFLSSYSVLLAFSMRRLYPSKIFLAWYAIIPGVFDLAETMTIILLLAKWISYPPPWLGLATCLKWTIGASVIALVLGGPIINTRKKFQAAK